MTTIRDDGFGTKLQNTSSSIELNLDGIGSNEDNAPHGRRDNSIESLQRWATEIVRDVNDEIVVLDVQELPVRAFVDQLQQLKKLRRLRMGHETQTKRTFETIAGLASLRELEISGHRLDPSSFKRICRLENLTRLQLPMAPVVDFWECRHPERIPFLYEYAVDEEMLAELWRQASDANKLVLSPSDSEDGYGEDGGYGYGSDYGAYLDDPYSGGYEYLLSFLLDEGDFEAIANLAELEYLFMPGYLLSKENIGTILKLSKLKELHALHSLVDAPLLRRIRKLDNLEALSIGTLAIDAAFLRSLSEFKELKTLQVMLFDRKVQESPKLQGILKAQVQKALPNGKVHFVVASSPEY